MDVEEVEEEDDDVDKENRSQDQEAHFTRACAVERHMDTVQRPFCMQFLTGKTTGDTSGNTVLCEPFCVEIYRKSAVRQSRDTRFVRACAVETHMDSSQEPFCVEIYRELAGHGWYHLDETPGRNTYRKNPFSLATLFGGTGLYMNIFIITQLD